MKKDKKDNLTVSETPETTQNAPEVLGEDVIAETSEGESNSEQLPPNVVERKQRRWLPYVITAAVLAVFTVLVGWARGVFTETDTVTLLICWCDAFTVPGILGVAFGLLVVASNGGAFDMLAYGVKSIFRLLKRDPIDRKYGGYYEYQQARRSKKRSFWYMIIVGGAYLLVGIVLLVVYLQLESQGA